MYKMYSQTMNDTTNNKFCSYYLKTAKPRFSVCFKITFFGAKVQIFSLLLPQYSFYSVDFGIMQLVYHPGII